MKLVVRQGLNTDRLSATLASGELGYTTDHQRLFVGNGTTGGSVVGNKFLGDLNSGIMPGEIGDTAYHSGFNKYYALSSGDGTNFPNDWRILIGLDSIDPHLIIDSNHNISLSALSAGKISSNAVQSPLIINSNGKIALSSLPANYISLDAVQSPITINSGRIALNGLSSYNISSDAVQSPLIISNGKVALSSSIPSHYISSNTIKVTGGLKALDSVGADITDIAVNPLNRSIVIYPNTIVATISSGSMVYCNRSGTSFTNISDGLYKLTYMASGTVIPSITLNYPLSSNLRTVGLSSVSNTQCIWWTCSGANIPVNTDAYITLTIVT